MGAQEQESNTDGAFHDDETRTRHSLQNERLSNCYRQLVEPTPPGFDNPIGAMLL
jgi:hypothetical protein